MKLKTLRSILLAACLALSVSSTAIGGDECIQFRVVGVCIWIVCTMFGCDIDVTIKYGHFNPDALITVNNPQGVNRVEDPRRIDTHNRNHNNLVYRDAIAIGHRLTGEIYCPSNTSAGDPYFASQIDIPAWRTGELSVSNLLSKNLHKLGGSKNSWGYLYPRTGWVIQHSEPKAAAIVAQRVGDIITRDNQDHVYQSILGDAIFVEDDKFTWSPESLIENSNEEGWLQMTSPEFELECFLAGKNDLSEKHDWGGGRVSDDGDYIFALWRPYTCCEVDDGALVVIDFTDFPAPIIKN